LSKAMPDTIKRWLDDLINKANIVNRLQ